MPRSLQSAALAACLLLAPSLAVAQTVASAAETDGSWLPLWEAGVAAAVGTTADYPGSDRYRLRVIPFPYFVYRGRFFRSDENGARVRALHTRKLEFELSGGAAFSTHSSGSGPRAGMPDLDYLLELGPKLKYTFARPVPDVAGFLELPLRVVVSTNGRRLAYRGLVLAPDVGVRARRLLGSRWSGYADVGPEFASVRLQEYFYEVPVPYARPGRPAYAAHGGYFGSRLELGLSRPLGDDFRVFLYGRLEDYAGAENTGSPLFQTRLGTVVFVGFSWSFVHSTETVAPDPD